MAKKTLTQATYDVDNVQQLPVQVKGQASLVQQTFDKASLDQKTYNNTTLLTELQSETLNDSGAHRIGLNALNVNADNVADGIAENRAAIAETQLGQIADNTLTEAKMAAEMKKQAGGVAEYNTVDALQQDFLTIEDDIIVLNAATNPSSIFNGLEKDGSGRLTLWENPQTASAFNESVTQSYPSIYNDSFDIFVPNANGNFFRAFLIHIRNSTNSDRCVSILLDTRNKQYSIMGKDALGNVKMSQVSDGSSILINSTDDIGCGTFITDTGKQYTIGFEYLLDGGVPKIRFSVAGLGGGGGYPHDYDFRVSYEGLV